MGERIMTEKIVAFSLFFALIILGVQSAEAQFGRLTGAVVGEDGEPWLEGVVSIDREDIRGHYEVKTDESGRFFHAGLPLGQYSVSVVENGKKLYTQGNINIRMSEPANVRINLREERARTDAAAAGMQLEEDDSGRLTEEQMAALEEAAREREEAIRKSQELRSTFAEAMAAMRSKDYDTAITAFQAAAEVDPDQDVIYAQLGEAYSSKAAATRDAAEKEMLYTQSIESYQKSIDLKPDDASYHNNFGLALAKIGKTDEAQVELRKAGELDPVNGGQYFFNLGAVLVNQGNMEAATDAFRQATVTDPDFAEAFYQLGVTLIGMATVDPDSGRMVPAEGTLEALMKYLEITPSGPNAPAAQSLLDTLAGSVQTSLEVQ
jgi:tetratricopeptide (TPR) repeat protein